jgi:hypothetical protein
VVFINQYATLADMLKNHVCFISQLNPSFCFRLAN